MTNDGRKTPSALELRPDTPAYLFGLGGVHEDDGEGLGEANEDDEAPVVAAGGLDDAAADGDADEAGDGDESVAGGVVAAVVLRVAQLADTHGGDANVVSRREAEHHSEDDQPRHRAAERQPYHITSDDCNT